MNMALGIGLGLTVGGITPAWTFAQLNSLLGSAALAWFEAVPGYLFDDSTVATGDSGTVHLWIDRRDVISGLTRAYATASADGLTRDAASKSVVFDGTNYLSLSSPQNVSAVPSAFYLVCAADSAIGSATDRSAVTVSTDTTVLDSSGNGASTTNGTFASGLVRAVRGSFGGGNNIRIAATNVAERFDGISNDFTLDLIGAHSTAGPTVVPQAAASKISAVLVLTQDPIAAGWDGAIRSYLKSTFGVAL